MFQRVTLPFIASVIVVACSGVEPIPIYTPEDFGLGLSSAAFSPSGQLAAVANFNTVWILDTISMKKLMSFSGFYRFGTNNTLVFINENSIASTAKIDDSGGEDFHAAVNIFNIRDQFSDPLVIALPELGRYAISLSHSAETGALAVGGGNGAVVLLQPNAAGGYKKRKLPGLSGPVLDIVFSRDGKMLAAGGVHPSVPIWSTESFQEVGSLPVNGNVYDLDLIADKKTLLVAGDELGLWKFLSEEELETINNPSLAGDYITVGTAVAVYTFLAILAGGQGGGLPIGGSSLEPDYGFCTRVTDVSPSGEYVVDVDSGITKEKIRVIDIASGDIIVKLNPRGGRTCGAAFNPDGTKLLIANNRVARLYDTTAWTHEDFDFN